MFLGVVLLVTVLALGGASLYIRFCRAGRLLSKIPGPTKWPLIGNTFDIILPPEALFVFLRTLRSTFRGLTSMAAFNVRAVNIYDPDDVETILSTTRYNEKQQPYTFFRPWLAEGLLISNGDKWRQRRKLLTPAFHFNILRQFANIFNEKTEVFLELLHKEVGKEKTDLVPLISKATLDIMCETSMGTSMSEEAKTISSKYFKAIQTLGQCVVYQTSRIWLHVNWISQLSYIGKLQKVALNDLHSFTNRIISERKAYRERTEEVSVGEEYGRKNPLAMLDLLLKNEKEGKIDTKGIREEVDTFLFEGHDTTAMALCFMIMRIANEPKVQKQLHEEMTEVFGKSTRMPTIQDLNDLKYLECCIKESLRLYPSVHYIARYITEDVVLSGYKVPANTICNIHVYDIHRDPNLYPDPEQFHPERFLSEPDLKRHPYAYIPFSAGPRNCIGQKFAMLELKTVMSGILRQFHLAPVTRPADIVFLSDIVLRAKHPIFVKFCSKDDVLVY